jgi:hypothetical protein
MMRFFSKSHRCLRSSRQITNKNKVTQKGIFLQIIQKNNQLAMIESNKKDKDLKTKS